MQFDSKLESRYYEHLLELKEQGIVKRIELQPKYLLQPGFKKHGKTWRKMEYIADFLVEFDDGTIEVIDTKGSTKLTADFSIKWKILEHRYPDLRLRVLHYVKKHGGWIEHDHYKKLKRREKKNESNS